MDSRVLKKILLKLIPWLIVAVVAYFFTKTIANNWQAVEKINLEFNSLIIAAIILFILAVVISGLLWGRLLNTLNPESRVSFSDAIKIHSASWLLKYVPGQVGSIANKLAWGKQKGISQKTITNSFIYENVLLLLASLIVSAPVLVLFQDQLGQDVSLFLPLLVIVPIILIVYKPIFSRLLNWIFRKLGRKQFKDSDFLSTAKLLKFLLLYLLPRVLTGVAFVLIASSFLEVSPDMYLGLASAYVLATVVGLLAIFVPGGIGVREAVIVLLVSVYFPTEQAIVLSLLARFYSTLADLGVGAVYLILNKGRLNYHD